MKDRTAFSCSSSLPWASANLRSMPSFLASSCMSLDHAGRQSPSSPTCEKPMVSAKADDPPTTSPKPTAAPPTHLIKCINSSLLAFQPESSDSIPGYERQTAYRPRHDGRPY